ncbi:MAG: aminopeptidase [Planctomycetes bacterium]|nr:aminopeptidase [Planctomycetota bacterium]
MERPSRELLHAAERATKGALRVKPAERVVLITDRHALSIAEAFVHWFHHVRADLVTCLLAEPLRPADVLPAFLRRLVERADLTVCLIEERVRERRWRQELAQAALLNGRVCRVAAVSVETMERLVGINYAELQELAQKLIETMSGAREVRVTNALGTEVTFSVFGRRWWNDSGDISQRGQLGGLPAGECFVAPVEETFHGAVAYSMVDGKLEQGTVHFEKGRVVRSQGRRIRAYLERVGREAGGKVISEVGLGLNRSARLCEQVLEAEKSLGAVHFALGDGDGPGPGRTRHRCLMVVDKATVEADGHVVLKDGVFQI